MQLIKTYQLGMKTAAQSLQIATKSAVSTSGFQLVHVVPGLPRCSLSRSEPKERQIQATGSIRGTLPVIVQKDWLQGSPATSAQTAAKP